MKLALCACLLLALGCGRTRTPELRVGSKKFTESVLLGELARLLAADGGARAEHRRELGGTRVLWEALLAGEIDVYPEYTGTLREEILDGAADDPQQLTAALAKRGVVAGKPLGFDNTYAIGMPEARAAALGIRSISDLARHPELRFGLTSEFMDRADGWPGLQRRYALAPAQVRGLDHDLAYRALSSGTLDVTDLYSTDADIAFYKLRVLEDDRHYFPEYQALFLYRSAFVRDHPRLHAAIERLAGRIDEEAMRELNAEVKLKKRPESLVAAEFSARALGISADVHEPTRVERLIQRTVEHVALTAWSLLAAIAFAVPLGVAAARSRALARVILAVSSVLQTIPSLALLVFMIPLFGIGEPPAIAALFLYSLLPIVRNTHAGLTGIDRGLLESAEVLGLGSGARLRLIELPLASPSILAGIKTAAVINVGTATLGALIGAGGYGQPILTGIRLSDEALILEGAIPAAALALLCQWGFDFAERFIVPRGLRR
ncbi:MAG TPA: glycine betaine ABC transporter substrate-binding protein [Polyangiales bacterium]|nr:glycine betaine ABC transporter substrate-binding protein [Polyangiales bacterium]